MQRNEGCLETFAQNFIYEEINHVINDADTEIVKLSCSR